MAKNRTKVKHIEDSKSRNLAFYKRRKGLLKKAMELSIMCNVNMLLIVMNPNGK